MARKFIPGSNRWIRVRTDVRARTHAHRYGPNLRCSWRISGEGSITLRFSSLFDLEQGYDFVKIYHHPSGGSASLAAAFSGDSPPRDVRVPSGDLLVVFSSDGSLEGRGFQAGWSTVLKQPRTASPMFLASLKADSSLAPRTAAERCGRSQIIDLRHEPADVAGLLSDGPREYAPNERCSWSVRASRPIVLTFIELELEDGRDVVKVFGGVQAMVLLAVVSGTEPPPPIKTPCEGGALCQMLVNFEADAAVQVRKA